MRMGIGSLGLVGMGHGQKNGESVHDSGKKQSIGPLWLA